MGAEVGFFRFQNKYPGFVISDFYKILIKINWFVLRSILRAIQLIHGYSVYISIPADKQVFDLSYKIF